MITEKSDESISTKETTSKYHEEILAPFNPTCSQAQNIAIELLSLRRDDVLFDLGCGDGRFLINAAAQTSGLTCVGVELNPVYYHRAVDAITSYDIKNEQSLKHRIHVHLGNLLEDSEFSKVMSDTNGKIHGAKRNISELTLMKDATCVFLYLLPQGIAVLKPILKKCMEKFHEDEKMNEFRVVSYMFHIPDWNPIAIREHSNGHCKIYLYNAISFEHL